MVIQSKFFYVLIIVLSSCSISEKDKKIENPIDIAVLEEMKLSELNRLRVDAKDKLILNKGRIISFKVDSTSRNFTLVHSFYKDSISYFVNRNEFTNSIDFYNYDTGDLERRLTVNQEEPNGISKLEGFYVHNLDSIFAYSRRDNIIHLYDFEGELSEYYKMPNDKSFVLPTHIYSGMHYNSPSMYFSYSSIYPLDKLKDTVNMVGINLINNSISRVGPKTPSFLTENDIITTHSVTVFNKGHENKFLVKFKGFPLVYTYDIKSNSTKGYLVRSKYHNENVETWGGKEDKAVAYMEPAYGKVCYDPFRNVYYHLFSLDTPYLNEDGEKNTFDDKQMSVIITDTTFQILGEKLLEKNAYFRNMLVSEDGLMISTANAYNKDEKESEIRFQLFKLDSLQLEQ